jgi:ADP-Ribosyltransferase in polyvalent proteins/Large polyvalent protein-associated domain 3
MFGQSLIPYMIANGGLVDDGGELSARDVNVDRKRSERLIREGGRSLDDMAELLVQGGYITERSEAAVLEAIDRELGGSAVYVPGAENAELMEANRTLQESDQALQEAGLDINDLTNDQIKAVMFAEQGEGRLSQPANEQAIKDVEQAYGGKAAYEKAKEAGRTNLTYEQWLQVRTPAFKAWFGDWEIASSEPAREASTFVEAREQAGKFQGKPLTNVATGFVATVSRNNLDKMLNEKAVGKSETPAIHSLAVANLDNLFERAILGWSKPDSDGNPNVKEIHRFFAPITVEGKAMLAKITVKETVDPAHANGLYTVESVVFEAIKNPATQWVDASANADGIDLTSIRSAGLITSMAQAVQDFNPDAVSKVTDPKTGEPLVVHHGSSTEFSVFNNAGRTKRSHTRIPHETMTNQSFALAENKRVAEFFANEAVTPSGILYPGSRVMTVYLSIKNPLIVDMNNLSPEQQFDTTEAVDTGETIHGIGLVKEQYIRDAKQNGHDGVIFKNGYDFRFYSGDIYFAFDPTQIKSATDNNGDFDPHNPNIL